MLNKTIVITGATSGIGEETAIALAKKGHTVYLLVRNIDKGERAMRNIQVQAGNTDVHVIECNLASLASVRQAADELKTKLDKIDVLINNAGGIFPRREVSADGFELTFALNHLGPFLLTLSLMPLLKKAKARIINVSSEAYKTAKVDFDDLQSEQSYNSIKTYGTAKLFNIYFTQTLAEKYADTGITAYSVHPGIVNTKFGATYTGFFKLFLKLMRGFMVPAKQGAETSVFLADEPGIEKLNGQYFKNCKPAKTTPIAHNLQARQTLWGKSEQLVKAYL